MPGIIEWPVVIQPRVTNYPACVMDLFPTVEEIVGLPESAMTKPIDGLSLRPLFAREIAERSAPTGFRYQAKRALIDDRYKLLTDNLAAGKDYPESQVSPPDPDPVNWYDAPQDQPFLTEWKQRWEYEGYLNRATIEKKKRKN